jgi:hypothetical protein
VAPGDAGAAGAVPANVQRLLDEGLFVASYKYALLLALADLCLGKSSSPMTCPLGLAVSRVSHERTAKP